MCGCAVQPCNKCGTPQPLDNNGPCAPQILTINEVTGDLNISPSGNTVNLVDLIENFQTISRLGTFTLTGSLLTLTFIAEDGVTQSKTVDLSTLSISAPTNIPVEDTNTIDLTWTGTTLRGDVIIDPASTAPISASSFGINIGCCPETAVTASNTNTILLTASGIQGHTLVANLNFQNSGSLAFAANSGGLFGTVQFSSDAGNSAIPGSDGGVYVPSMASQLLGFTANGFATPSVTNLIGTDGRSYQLAPTVAQSPITPIDSQSVNLTVSGVNNMSLQADVIIDNATPGNVALAIGVNGLQANATCQTILETLGTSLATVALPLTNIYGRRSDGPCAYTPVTMTPYGWVIPPFTTTARNALPGGDLYDTLLIFNTTTRQFQWYDAVNTIWQPLT